MMNKTQLSIGLINPKSPDNVGAILRASANYQVDSVFYTGIRYPQALKRAGRSVDMSRKLGKDIPITQADCLIEAVTNDVKIVCIEFAEGAVALPEFVHPEQALYIFGPEDGSIEQGVIDKADHVVFVPTISCMNLSASVNVLLYDRMAKSYAHSHQGQDNNALIKTNRDTNNRLKVNTTT